MRQARMTVRTRFAPSPTGRLHLGHAYSAMVARNFARERGGEFLLRHEDIDSSRVREEFYTGIEDDLRWLGLDWDGDAMRQTGRIDAYDAALRKLRDMGMVYPCFCTRREIQDEWARMGAAPQGPEGPVYPGTCRNRNDDERARRIDAGESHAWRLDSAAAAKMTGPLTFKDLRAGKVDIDPALLGDVVLARKDIGCAYHLAVVVDDAFQDITHVIRGEDLLPSTHVHRTLQCLLGIAEPVYLHHPLVVDEDGKRLAKRHDSLAVATLRERGRSPDEVLAMAERSGSMSEP